MVGPHAAPDGQRHKALLSRARRQIKHRAAVFLGRHDIEKAKLIRAGSVVCDRGIHRLAGIHQIDKVHAFDHAAFSDVQTGDDAGF